MNSLLRTILVMIFSFSVHISPASASSIALSFDDAPRGDTQHFSGSARSAALIKALRKAGLKQTVFFCNSVRMNQAGRRRIVDYVRSGHLIANHTHTHPRLKDVGVDRYLADISSADQILRPMPGFVSWFRYPFLNEGGTVAERDQIRRFLAAKSYINAYVTVDNYDFYIDYLFQEALAQKRTIDYEKLRKAYVDILWQAIVSYDQMATKTLGRSPKHILLLHENDMAALFIGDLISHIRAQGWQIITPGEAYEDDIARIVPNVLMNNQGRIGAIAQERGYPGPFVHPLENEEELRAYFIKNGAFK